MNENKIPVIEVGYLPNFEGEPVLASCNHCSYCEDDSDGWEYGPAYYICNKKPHMSNLKGFPFQTAQKCCVLHFSFMVDWNAVAEKERLEDLEKEKYDA
jgi:hypothetical protein